jgi:ribose-phosphate pyrophosphokinase
VALESRSGVTTTPTDAGELSANLASLESVAEDLLLFAGSASRKLGGAIADYLGCPLGASESLRFSEGNLFVRVLDNVRGRDVFLVQGTAFPANDNFMELLFWIDALKRASAASVTAVIPYFSYAKGDKKDEPRVSIRARVCADAIEAAGVDRVVTLDLHAPQVQGFFKVPVDDLYAMPVLCDAIAARSLPDLVVVAPDAGFAKKARQWADRLHAPLAIAEKRRIDHSESAEVVELIGSVAGRTALVVDDFTISAGTLVDAARILVERGASAVYAAVSHGLLAGSAGERLDNSPIKQLFMTDSVETQPSGLSSKVEVVSVADLLGEAIARISRRESISVLFS